MLVLVTNDDGVESPGLTALAGELRKLGEVVVAAPSDVQSAVSNSITVYSPLKVRQERRRGIPTFIVDGTPADCVKLALHQLLRRRPDLVVSGINIGLNTGPNVLYSGTVAGALEASMHEVTSFALSLEVSKKMNFEGAARRAIPIIRRLASTYPRSSTVFNINIPAGRVKGTAVCAAESVPCDVRYEERRDPRGGRYFWLKPERLRPVARRNGGRAATSDVVAVSKGYISLSPLRREITHREALEDLNRIFRNGRTM